jgi:homoserine kinase
MISVRIPATTANLGPGFDTLGMALQLYNEVELMYSSNGSSIEIVGEGAHSLPRNENNIVYQSIAKFYAYLGKAMPGLKIRTINRIPLARGLGSSSAAIIGGLSAANALEGSPFNQNVILDLAMELEGHPDNITPALVGGLTISCVEGNKVHYIKTNPPPELKAIVAIPDFQVATADARKVLPVLVSLHDAVFNVSRSSLVVASMMSGQLSLLESAMQDRLHQQYRAGLIPGLEDVFASAREAGALAVVISGSGPTVIAFGTESLASIGEGMKNGFAKNQISCKILETGICLEGTRIIS